MNQSQRIDTEKDISVRKTPTPIIEANKKMLESSNVSSSSNEELMREQRLNARVTAAQKGSSDKAPITVKDDKEKQKRQVMSKTVPAVPNEIKKKEKTLVVAAHGNITVSKGDQSGSSSDIGTSTTPAQSTKMNQQPDAASFS